MEERNTAGQIAIIGMSGRFPGAPDLDVFWNNLAGGVESISFFSEEELDESGVSAQARTQGRYVPARGIAGNTLDFDAGVFEINVREAALMDPQFRVLLELTYEALERAGYAGQRNLRVGIFAGAGANTYQEYLRTRPGLISPAQLSQATMLNQADFLASWIAYKLDLTGPCVTVQTACSTSLAAVHLASQSLLAGECDLAVAGGVSLLFPQRSGYFYSEGGLYSADGHCRPFDSRASGFVPSEGAGVVVLKRLQDALEDTVQAVIRGSAMTNDGAQKISFTTPSQRGIGTAVSESIAMAEVICDTIGFIEASGAGTTLGDPLEIAALTEVFREHTAEKRFCAIGSVKTNIGHTNAAAGIASLIKAVLAIEHGVIPPSLHCEQPNPLMKLDDSPFYINSQLVQLPSNGPRRAGVNSFGIGGTNVHLTLEEAPHNGESDPSDREQLIILSAKTEHILERMAHRLADYMEKRSDISLADASFTLATGRRELEYRRTVVCKETQDAIALLRRDPEQGSVSAGTESAPRKLVFVFSDVALSLLRAAAVLYREEPAFRELMDQCFKILKESRNLDLRALFLDNASCSQNQQQQTEVVRALTVACQYSWAQLLMGRGALPQGVVAWGAGEISAACVAELMTINDGLSLASSEPTRISYEVSVCHRSSPGPKQPSMSLFLGSHGQPIQVGETLIEGIPLAAPTESASFKEDFRSALEDPDHIIVAIDNDSCSENLPVSSQAQRRFVSIITPAETIHPREVLTKTIARLWLAGAPIDWQRYYAGEKRRRVYLPTYPFERCRYAVDNLVPAEMAGLGPLTSSVAAGNSAVEYAGPETDLQYVIASMWSFYLAVEKIGIDDNFFALGGNSIIATRIVAAVRNTLQIDLPLRSLLEEKPTVRRLSEIVVQMAAQWDLDIHEIAKVVREIQTAPSESEDTLYQTGCSATELREGAAVLAADAPHGST